MLASAREYMYSKDDPPSMSDLIDRVVDVQMMCPPAAVRAATAMMTHASVMHAAPTREEQQEALARYMRDGLLAFTEAVRDYFGLEPLRLSDVDQP